MVQKYKPVINDMPYKPYAYCEENEEGIYVRLEDYQKLEAELEQLRQQVKEPEDDGWIEWDGREGPVATGTMVKVRWRNGKEDTDDSHAYQWGHSGEEWDVVAYKVLGPSDVIFD